MGGEPIDWSEINTVENKGLRRSLYPGVVGGLQEGAQTPQFPINAPWDTNYAAGMNMYRDMGGMTKDYQPQQMFMMFNPEWQPKWPTFPDYSPTEYSPEDQTKLDKWKTEMDDTFPFPGMQDWWETNKHLFGK